MIASWFDAYPNVRRLLDYYVNMLRSTGMVWTAYGRPRLIPEIYSRQYVVRASGIRKSGNTPIQGTAADKAKIAMRNVHDYFQHQATHLGVFHNVVIHDELVQEVPEDGDLQEMVEITGWIMENVLEEGYGVPLVADGKVLEWRWKK
jgi:DNA polymerase-1